MATNLRVGSREIVDQNRFAAAAGVDLEPLDVVQADDGTFELGVELHLVAVGQEQKALARAAAECVERVGAALVRDRIVAVAGEPGERVVALPQDGKVVADAALDHIVARRTPDEIVAVVAEQAQADLAGGDDAGIDEIVAIAAVNHEHIDLAEMIDADLRRKADLDDLAAGHAEENVVVVAGARDRHRVDLGVGRLPAARCRQIDDDLGDAGQRKVADVHRCRRRRGWRSRSAQRCSRPAGLLRDFGSA